MRRSAFFLEQAYELFPPGGSADGRPSFELFADGPLVAVEQAFSRIYEQHPEAMPGIRFAMTHCVPVFPALVVYATLADHDTVELLSITIDEDYFGMVGDDPE